MRHEVTRIDPIRAGNVGAIVYGLLMVVFTLLFAPIWVVVFLVAPSSEVGVVGGAVLTLVMVVFYPLMGVVMGWIMGAVGSFIYNLVVRWVGGFLLELRAVPGVGSEGPT